MAGVEDSKSYPAVSMVLHKKLSDATSKRALVDLLLSTAQFVCGWTVTLALASEGYRLITNGIDHI